MHSLLGLVLLLVSSQVHANSDWLNQQVQSDGRIAATEDIATPLQSTAEALRALQILGIEATSIKVAAQAYLNEIFYASTEILARRTIAAVEAETATAHLTTSLLARHNADGGFGELAANVSTVLDTAWALEALALAGHYGAQEVTKSLNFLQAQQAADGSWTQHGTTSVYLTAQALRSAWSFRHLYPISGMLNGAQNYLLQQRDSAGQWEETYLTAAALIAILPNLSDRAGVQNSVDGLLASQLANGSWNNDVFTTALAIRALALNATNNPDLGHIQVEVMDGQTSQTLSSVQAILTGPTPGSVVSGNHGKIKFADLIAPATYDLQFNMNGYVSVITNTHVAQGQSVDLGTVQMLPTEGQSAGTVFGNITEAGNNTPINDASVTATVNGSAYTATTAENGTYQINGVPAGPASFTAAADGYQTVSMQGHVPQGGIVTYSPILANGDDPIEGNALQGLIIEAATGNPLPGASIAIGGGRSTLTDAGGYYHLDNMTLGQVQVQINKPGYDSVTTWVEISESTVVTLSLSLYAEGATPEGENSTGATGLVLDSTNNTPLIGASVSVSVSGVSQNISTDSNGRFLVNDLSATTATFAFSQVGYSSVDYVLPLQATRTLDMGQIRLRPEGVTQQLPDLTVLSVDAKTHTTTDLATLLISGDLHAVISNRGTASAAAGVEIIAFHDANFDSGYSAESDVLLGSISLNQELVAGQESPILVPVHGSLPFRDAPVHIFVDHTLSIVESDESNNTGVSNAPCEIPDELGGLEAVVKWEWTTSSIEPEYNRVMASPIVVPIADTNGDGISNQLDDPAVIFSTFKGRQYNSDGILRAVSGIDGQEIWSVANTALRIVPTSQIAAADIDGDGWIEVVAAKSGGGLLAFNHDGTLLWEMSSSDAPYVGWGALSIADIDADGIPEIVIGNAVINNDGTIRWKGNYSSLASGLGPISITADINLDGKIEILDGGLVFDGEGNILSGDPRSSHKSFSAVADFVGSPHPEIVTVSYRQIEMLDYLGNRIWGPTWLDGGRGGPPTIADFDNDGKPEIGVAGSRNYFAFDGDGSILWNKPIYDISSSSTSSTAFDLDGNGSLEVIYSDQNKLYLFNGLDGTVLTELENHNGTAHELPVVVDVDNDGHADIVVTQNDLVDGNSNGIRALQEVQNRWLPTRSIWNQHAYHITNVNDDGTIPAVEENSWDTHNTYRVNALLERPFIRVADATIAMLQVIDQGINEPVRLRARIGNAGRIAVPVDTQLTFYDGNPAANGVLLGTVTTNTVDPGHYQDVELPGVSSLSGDSIFAIVDPINSVDECNEDNNTISAPALAKSQLGQIVATTDATEFSPDSTATLIVEATNTGSLAGWYTVEIIVTDSNGAVVQRFPITDLIQLQGGQSTRLEQQWNTAATIAGDYRLLGVLRDEEGVILNESTASFSLRHDPTNGPLASLRSSTDQARYHTTASVQLMLLAQNLTRATLIDAARVLYTVRNAQGLPVATDHVELGQLAPGSIRQHSQIVAMQSWPEGNYTIDAQLQDASTAVLAQAQSFFSVFKDVRQSLSATVTAQYPQVARYNAQHCTDSVRNVGDQNLTALPLRQRVIDVADDSVVDSVDLTVDIAKGGSYTVERSVNTVPLAEGPHLCTVEALIDNVWTTLAYDAFEVLPADIDIAARWSFGHHRILALTDAQATPNSATPLCQHDVWRAQFEADFTAPLQPDASVVLQLLQDGVVVDFESASLAAFDGEINANIANTPIDLAIPTFSADELVVTLTGNNIEELLGENYAILATVTDSLGVLNINSGIIDIACNATDALINTVNEGLQLVGLEALNEDAHSGRFGDGIDQAAPQAQANYLEQQASQAGWRAHIVNDSEQFAHQFARGHFDLYLLLAEYAVPTESQLKELREAVFNGAGLLVAGRVDERSRILDELLGIKHKGTHIGATGLELHSNPQHTGGTASFAETNEDDQVQRVRLNGAQMWGEVLTTQDSAHTAIVTQHHYGQGIAVYVGFDLLAEATLETVPSLFSELLLAATTAVQPAAQPARAGGNSPLVLKLDNQGIAIPLQVTTTTSAGTIVDATAGFIGPADTLTWSLDLAEGASASTHLWLSLPYDGAASSLTANIKALDNGILVPATSTELTLTPPAAAGLTQAIAELEALIANQEPALLPFGKRSVSKSSFLSLLTTPAEEALAHLRSAEQALANSQLDTARSELLNACDDMIVDGSNDIAPIRHLVGTTLRAVSAGSQP